MTHEPDYYTVLGLGRLASPADVDRAYRRAARATHPDVHPDDASAADRFRTATRAYETLRDPDRRASYDRRQTGGRPNAGIRIVVYRRPAVAPVQVGRRDLFELVESFARIVAHCTATPDARFSISARHAHVLPPCVEQLSSISTGR